MPAMRVCLPSVAPVDMVATRGTPGQTTLRTFSMACVTSGRSGDGGTGTTGTTFPSGERCGTTLILTFGSVAKRTNVSATSCGHYVGENGHGQRSGAEVAGGAGPRARVLERGYS